MRVRKVYVIVADVVFWFLSAATAVVVFVRSRDQVLPEAVVPYVPYYLGFFVFMLVFLLVTLCCVGKIPGQVLFLAYMVMTCTVAAAMDVRVSDFFFPFVVAAFVLGLSVSISKIYFATQKQLDKPVDSKFKP